MLPRLSTWSAPLLFAATLAAQGSVGLSFVSGPTASTAFSPAKLGNGITSVAQLGMIPHPNGTPGLYLGGMTVTGLSAALGGLGAFDVVSFTYDRGTDTATLNANAASFNTTGSEFALNWGRDGTYAVADRPTGVFQATTGTPGGVLAAAVAVTGIGAAYVDPCPAVIGGSRVIFFDNPAGGLAWSVHDVPTAKLTGSIVVVSTPSGTNISHSPWPMVGADGDAEGLIGCEANASFSDSDWNWQGDNNSATVPIVQKSTPGAVFENNGCEAGGRVYMPQTTAGVYTVQEFNVVGLMGDSVKSTGGTLDLTAFSPTKASGTPDVTIFVLGVAFLNAPLTVPGINNALGLDPAPGVVILGIAAHSNVTGRAVFTLPTPPLGVGTIPVQGVTVLGTGPTHFTSTAVATIVP